MKRFYLLVCGLMAMSAIVDAENISGRVLDEQGHEMPFVTISLMTTDSALITGAVTDDNGNYTVSANKGNYILQISFIGYATQTSNIQLSTSILKMDDIVLHEETATLKEVEVTVKRPLIERQMDKIIMNVAESPFAIGNSSKELLKKAPGVMIDKDGNISVNGKSVEVYIDGRPSYLSGEQLRGMLEGTDGATIDKIEIITNPSSKYDASGQGGIINIKLKRNKSKGFNGMLSASYGGMYFEKPNRYYQNDFVSLNLNYRSQYTYTAFSLTQVYADMGVNFSSYTQQPQEQKQPIQMNSVSDYRVNFQYYMARLSNDWYIDSTNTLGFILQVPIMVQNLDISDKSRNYAQVWQGNDTLQSTRTSGYDKSLNPQHTANLNFTHNFDEKLSRELTINADYNRYSTSEHNLQDHTILINKLPTILPKTLDIHSAQVVDIYSGKMDFQTAFWETGMLECGAKYAMANTFNKMQTDSIMQNNLTISDTTKYDYSEQVGALYISAAKQFGPKWSVKLGLRGELTAATGIYYQNSERQEVKKKPYFNLFPSAFIGYNPTEKWNTSISYTRRIKRPAYSQLNPFVTYLDAHTSMMGNPDLNPEFNHQVDMNFGWSQYVTMGLVFSHTNDMLGEETHIKENGDVFQKWINFGTCTTHGATVSLTEIPLVPKFKTDAEGQRQLDGAWLSLTTSGGAFHFINKSYDGNYTNKNWWGNWYGCLNAYLPRDYQISVDGYWQADITTGYRTWKGNYGMNCALKKQLLQKTLTLTLKVDDLLRSSNFDMETAGLAEGQVQRVSQDVYRQCVSVGVSWMFGQYQNYKYRSKAGNALDESSRLGGSSGVGTGK